MEELKMNSELIEGPRIKKKEEDWDEDWEEDEDYDEYKEV